MPKLIEGEKKWILEKRLKMLFKFFDDGMTDADIARICFNVNRSTITRIRISHWKEHLLEKSR